VVHVERGLLARSVVAALVADAVALRENEQQGAAALADAQAAAAEAYAAKASGPPVAAVQQSSAFILLCYKAGHASQQLQLHSVMKGCSCCQCKGSAAGPMRREV
jgi:tRNA G26 N,N-dimethylase Trm1